MESERYPATSSRPWSKGSLLRTSGWVVSTDLYVRIVVIVTKHPLPFSNIEIHIIGASAQLNLISIGYLFCGPSLEEIGLEETLMQELYARDLGSSRRV